VRVWAGTSGYSYKEWKGSFYPEDLANDEMLGHYAGQLPAVEINNTFYRMPTEKLLARWAEQVPPDFRFAIKAPRRITHKKCLKDAEDETEYLTRTVSTIGDRLGVILFQLPPYLKKGVDRLEGFLAQLPEGVRAAFEFRHPSWYEDEVFEKLKAAGAALCIAEAGGKADAPNVATADWGYLRLRRADYSDADLAAWADRVRSHPWSDAFVFFKHEDEAAGPAFAKRFLELTSG
ncbi:MAG: DUF72 domain-containing protein, partial [Gemmatimonadota bacterium]|jgi:uncharacterized protein YecE (DUF72 family)